MVFKCASLLRINTYRKVSLAVISWLGTISALLNLAMQGTDRKKQYHMGEVRILPAL